MSGPTLEMLRAECESAIEQVRSSIKTVIVNGVPYPRRWDEWLPLLGTLDAAGWSTLSLFFLNPPAELTRAEAAARRYVIARDFNEVREGHWQMLWKLAYGGDA